MQPFLPEDEAAIVAACTEHQAKQGRGKTSGWILIEQYPYIVKYGKSGTLACYVETQSLLYNAEERPGTRKPRIPKLIHQFDNGQGISYVVLEAIKLVEHPDDVHKRIEEAATWLSGVRAPSDHLLGPLGGGCIRHPFFGDGEDGEAPLAFVDVPALQSFVDKARKRIYDRGKGINRIKLTEERLVWVQTKMCVDHFGVDEEGNTVMMGLGSISLLPETFARYILVSAGFATLADTLGLSGATHMAAMAAIAHNLGMSGGSNLGLDKYGKPVKRSQTTATGSLEDR